MDRHKTGGRAGDIIVFVTWAFAIGLVLAAAWGSRLLIAPISQFLEASSQSRPHAAPGSHETSVELGILYPVNGPVPNETELRAAGMSGENGAGAEPAFADQGTPGTVPPSWLEQPRPEFPATAARSNIDKGRVRMECFVRTDGLIAACMVIDETPPGYGFGRASIAAARDARLAPPTVDGEAKPGHIRFTTSYRLE